MSFIRTLITSITIIILLIVIGVLIALLMPAIGESLHKKDEVQRAHDLNNNVFKGK